MDNTLYWVWLTSMSGMFPNKINALMEHFDTIEDIYRANTGEYQKVKGISRADSLMLNSKDLTHAEEIVEKIKHLGAEILTYDDINYPDSLRKIDDPPYVLYVKGEIMQWERLLSIGVVGTRRCTEYGIKATSNIAYELASKGITIVSGMARGIDTAAATAALRAGNKTIAVLGCGLDVVYPPENGEIKKAIEAHGAVITEYPPGSEPAKHHFPQRNRIISGLSKGVIVIEAPMKSGALITANYAYDSGRDVFAVPGSIFSDNSKGSNLLIKQGAKAVCSAQDIIDEYPFDAQKLEPIEKSDNKNVNNVRKFSIHDEKYSELGETEKQIVSLLIEKNMHIDDIKNETGLDIGSLNSIMPMLEMQGFIRKIPGENYKLEV